MIAMTYDWLPFMRSVVCALVGYMKEVLFPVMKHAAQRPVEYVHDRFVGMRAIEVR